MNTEQLSGKWKQLKGKARAQWGKLTEDDWSVVEGKSEELVGRLQERYGIAKEEAEKQVDDFMKAQEDASAASAGRPQP